MNKVTETYEHTPFSCMLLPVVQELLSSTLPVGEEFRTSLLIADTLSTARIAHSQPLLTSGNLEHVDLRNAKYSKGYAFIIRMLSRGCRNLRTIALPAYDKDECVVWTGSSDDQALQELFLNCTNLEELHTPISFNPEYLKNCAKLRVLKLHIFTSRSSHIYSTCITDFCKGFSRDLLRRLGSFEMFAICFPFMGTTDQGLSILSTTVTLLDTCTELTSVGFLDSLFALKRLHDRDQMELETPRRFKLLSCCWTTGKYLLQLEYCHAIRVAAFSCPLLQHLEMNVFHIGSLEHLKVLKHLSSLIIRFHSCIGAHEHEFHSLLSEIGPQLRNLELWAPPEKTSYNLNQIFNHCWNLSSLNLECAVTATELYVNLLNLKSLIVQHCDRQSLLFLMSNCINLRVLFLRSAFSLEDDLLLTILRKNSFAELEVAAIYECSLSTSGLSRFVQSARKLKKLLFGTSAVFNDDQKKVNDEVARCVKNLNPNVSCYACWYYMHMVFEEFPSYIVRYCFVSAPAPPPP